jgi:DNA repair exonuclease SbcCD ATPase subunit
MKEDAARQEQAKAAAEELNVKLQRLEAEQKRKIALEQALEQAREILEAERRKLRLMSIFPWSGFLGRRTFQALREKSQRLQQYRDRLSQWESHLKQQAQQTQDTDARLSEATERLKAAQQRIEQSQEQIDALRKQSSDQSRAKPAPRAGAAKESRRFHKRQRRSRSAIRQSQPKPNN